MPSGDAVPAFWRPLKKRLEDSGVSRQQICTLLHLKESAVSELLGGKRAKAPDWDVVRILVEAAVKPNERAAQLAYWKQRLTELENELERSPDDAARPPAKRDSPEPPRVSCLICDDAYRTERFSLNKHDFEHAMRILAGARDELISEIESFTSAPIDSPEALAAFRDEFLDTTRSLLDGLGARVRQACRPHRLWFLHAGHTVLITQSLVAAGPVVHDDEDEADLELLIHTVLETLVTGETYYGPADPFLLADIPYADRHDRVVEYYYEIFESLSGVGAPGPEAARRMAVRTASEYQSRLRSLASECPELFIWAGMQDDPDVEHVMEQWPDDEVAQRLRELYRRLQTQKQGLDGLETLLKALARDLPVGGWPQVLSEIYQSDLQQPISPIGELEEEASGLRIPLLAEGYVNPAFRSATYHGGQTPHIDSWWDDKPLRAEIQGFLAGFLTSAPTVDKPLIILGDPGTGKSVLTRLLAARLPPADYLPIRIELRNVRSDVEAVKQITETLRAVTLNEHITWAAVHDSVATVLPVLIFDGFDELLQAGGADHWGYLEQIASLQESCAARGRPIAVIVTSRTVVADQAQIPDGCMMMRLEPFDGERVERWVGQWNRTNRAYFRRRTIEPLRSDVMQRYKHLAEQPLLLMMLALYFSISAKEQGDPDDGISRVQLYERLFSLFIRRQIMKLEPMIRPEALDGRVEREFGHLAVIAFAMFNRGRQGVTAEEADHDLDRLCPDDSGPAERSKLLFGRFFFIHEAKATVRKGEERRWYEFLHATFSEFLIARKIAGMLADGTPESLAGLFDILSHRPLSDRTRILDDLRDLQPPTAAVPELFKRSLHHRQDHVGLGASAPATPATYRYACYSANLLLLAVVDNRLLHISEVIDDETDPVAGWRSYAMLWGSQFLPNSWDAFTRTVSTVPTWTVRKDSVRRRDIGVRLSHRNSSPLGGDMLWTHSLPPDTIGTVFRTGDPDVGEGWPVSPPNEGFMAGPALRRSRFLHDPDIEPLVEPGVALLPNHEFLLDVIRGSESGQSTSAAHDLVSLAVGFPPPAGELLVRYESCIKAVDRCQDVEVQDYFIVVLTHMIARDREHLPADAVTEILIELSRRQRFTQSWLILLDTVVKGLGRTADADTVVLVQTLLEARYRARTFPSSDSWPPASRSTASAGPTEALLIKAADQILREDSDSTRHQAMLVLLRKAIDLRLEGWCNRYAERVFEDQEFSRQVAAGLTQLQWTYIRQVLINQMTGKRSGSWLLDGSHEPEGTSGE